MSIREERKRASRETLKRRKAQWDELPESTIRDPRVQAAIAFMNANLHRKIRSAQLAEVAKLSASRLSHLFKGEIGLSPGEYLMRLRMEKARHLLATSRLRVKEIMVMSGYDHKSLFVRHFRKVFGLAPSKYRKNVSIRDDC